MEYYVKSVIPIIESNYDKFTTTEKTIADFFIHNQKKMAFSVNHIAELLYTSNTCCEIRNEDAVVLFIRHYRI